MKSVGWSEISPIAASNQPKSSSEETAVAKLFATLVGSRSRVGLNDSASSGILTAGGVSLGVADALVPELSKSALLPPELPAPEQPSRVTDKAPANATTASFAFRSNSLNIPSAYRAPGAYRFEVIKSSIRQKPRAGLMLLVSRNSVGFLGQN